MKRWIYLLFVLLLVACAPVKQRSCNEISAAALRLILFKEITVDDLLTRIAQTYHVPSESIRVDMISNGIFQRITWTTEGIQYNVYIEESVATGAVLLYEWGRPSADQVIACLGTPERYRAEYTWDIPGNQLGFDLLFPAQGILAFGVEFLRSRPKEPPPIKGSFRLYGFDITQPGSGEQILREIYCQGSADLCERMLQKYKPWPQDWQNIVIEIDPGLHQ